MLLPPLLLFIALGTAVVLLGDYLAARTAQRFGVSYGWYAPLSWALYIALGALAAQQRLPLPTAGLVGAAVGFADGSVGALLAYRAGAMPWPQAPTAASLARGGALIAVMCTVLTLLGAAGSVALGLGRAV